MSELGKTLLGLGALLMVIGGIVLLIGRLGLPLGRLPGDISWRGKNAAVYFPLGTCLLISAILSAIFYVIARMRH